MQETKKTFFMIESSFMFCSICFWFHKRTEFTKGESGLLGRLLLSGGIKKILHLSSYFHSEGKILKIFAKKLMSLLLKDLLKIFVSWTKISFFFEGPASSGRLVPFLKERNKKKKKSKQYFVRKEENGAIRE